MPCGGTPRGWLRRPRRSSASCSSVSGWPRPDADPDPKTDAGPSLKLDHTVGPPLSWFQRSRRDFQALMGMLAGGTSPTAPWDPVADAEKKAAARNPETSQVAQPPPKAAAAPVDAKKATEERRLAETRRSEPDPKAAADAKAADEAKKLPTRSVWLKRGQPRTRRRQRLQRPQRPSGRPMPRPPKKPGRPRTRNRLRMPRRLRTRKRRMRPKSR